jgi:2-iminobutanoate/2-iminopropanoate deaminase
MSVDRLSPASVPPPNGLYSMVSVLPAGTRTAIIAGQTGRRSDGSIGEDSATQTTDAFARLFALVAEIGATPADIAHFRTLLVRRDSLAGFVAARAVAFGQAFGDAPPPTNTLAFISGLADVDAVVEIEAVVAVGPGPD